MATVTDAPEAVEWLTLADLLYQLGDVPPHRVRLNPTPGTATEHDARLAWENARLRCELVDRTLVEKAMGFEEARFALWLGHFLAAYLEEHDIGEVTGPDAPVRIGPGLVRMPDVAFASWERFPTESAAVPYLVPDLAVEISSRSNTRAEMNRKLDEYFRAGVRLVWVVDPRKRTVRVHSSPRKFATLTESDTLEAPDILPDFRLPIRRWFAQAERGKPR